MDDVLDKIEEAEHFLAQMKQSAAADDATSLRRNFSAFLSSARTVMQYLYERSKQQGGRAWYQQIAASSPWCHRFKESRDGDIHREPYYPIVQHTMFLSITPEDIEKAPTEDGVRVIREGVVKGEERQWVLQSGDHSSLLDDCQSYLDELRGNIQKAAEEGII